MKEKKLELNVGMLPSDSWREILSNLSKPELIKISTVNKSLNVLSKDLTKDLFWKNQLLVNFHFTSKTVERLLQNKEATSYENLYLWCQDYKLNNYQSLALEKLADRGLTENHFKGRDWFTSKAHLDALDVLVNPRGNRPKLSADEAIEKLDGTTQVQADSIHTNCILNRIPNRIPAMTMLLGIPIASKPQCNMDSSGQIHDVSKNIQCVIS